MPNLKVTKAKVRNHCPLCEGEVVDNQWPEHLMRCTGGKFPCKTCGKLFKKKEYLIRHEKKFHEKESVNQNDNGVDSGDEGWLTQDPGDLLGQVSSTDDSSSDEGVESCEENSEGIKEQSQVASNEDKGESEKEKHSAKPESRSPLEKGRVVRKRTEPAPVFAPKRSTPLVSTQSSGVCTSSVPKFSFGKTYKSSSTQTENQSGDGQKRVLKKRKLHKVVSTYTKDDKQVEEIVEEEEFEYME